MTERRLRLPPFAKSLSARLLLLTIAFVMLAEVLIYAPSIGRFRLTYLEERLAAAHLAILALEAAPDRMVSEEMARQLMSHVGAYSVALMKPDDSSLMLMVEKPEEIHAAFDLREGTFFGLIGDAVMSLLSDGSRVIRAYGPSPKDANVLVDIVMDEGPMRAAMIDYSGRILALSLIISLFTAALVYLSLHLLLVRPMRGITASMIAFRQNPEDVGRVIRPSRRSDEIGMAERELASMQEAVRAALLQKTRLAALGDAVTKINHDLRNILATAHLVSDRLAESGDPKVRAATPTLIGALDRALALCRQTLRFTREGPQRLELGAVELQALLDEVGQSFVQVASGEAAWEVEMAEPLEIEADREQLFRVLANLGQNALQAGADRLRVAVRAADGLVEIDLADNGPGLPDKVRANLFKPFAASTREDGSGLGLAIARELMHAHGGEISLVESSAEGSVFRLVLPRRQPAERRRPQHRPAAE